jgi:hypothetical protein
LGIGLELGHRGRITARYLLDQTMRGFAFRDLVETGADSSGGIESVTAATIDLKNRMSEGRIASASQNAGSIRIGFSDRVPADDRAQTDR